MRRLTMGVGWNGRNVLDELKNQWGLGGFTTHDILRSKVGARLTTLICNWWNVFARIDSIAGQLDRPTVWTLHLSIAFCIWLRGKALRLPAEAEKIVNELLPAPVAALG